MELWQIKYFLVLCDTLNFARAAERCEVSSPSLTRAVQRLEHELGGVLIRRERRMTHLTELGRLVQPMLQAVLAHAESTKTAAHRFVYADEKSLRLGITPSLGPFRLAPILAQFGARHPEIELTFAEADAEGLEELLLGGSIDVALTEHLGPPRDRLRSYRLYQERVVVVFPPGHRFERQETVRLNDLKGENFLLQIHGEMRAKVLQSCREQGFQPKIIARSERDDWIQTMVAAGSGVTLAPVTMHLGHGTLARPLVDPAMQRDISLVFVAGRPHDLPLQRLVSAIRAHKWDDQSATSTDGRRPHPALARPPELTEQRVRAS